MLLIEFLYYQYSANIDINDKMCSLVKRFKFPIIMMLYILNYIERELLSL